MQSRFLKSLFEFLDAHYDEHWDLDRLAQRTGYSKYHLCRAFHAATQEPLQTYLRRLRLSKAAVDLKRGVRVLDIALECGYQSQEAFHRAFKKMFGTTPKAFQQGQHHPSLLLKKPWDESLTPPHSIPVRSETRDAFSLFGYGGNFTYEDMADIEELWREFSLYVDSTDATYGVTLPSDAGFKYYASVQSEIKALKNQLTSISIPQQNYRVFRHTGTAASLLSAFNYIWGIWLPEQSNLDVQGIDFEYYPPEYDPLSHSSWVDIYVPVVERCC